MQCKQRRKLSCWRDERESACCDSEVFAKRTKERFEVAKNASFKLRENELELERRDLLGLNFGS